MASSAALAAQRQVGRRFTDEMPANGAAQRQHYRFTVQHPAEVIVRDLVPDRQATEFRRVVSDAHAFCHEHDDYASQFADVAFTSPLWQSSQRPVTSAVRGFRP